MQELKIDQSLCKGCYICQELCPRGVFEIEEKINEKGFQALKVFPERCKPCRLCEYLCPEGAIILNEKLKIKNEKFSEKKALKNQTRGGWKQVKSLLEPGKYFLSGNEAIVEGALAAGCRFFAGYPITPATEILEGMVQRMKKLGGNCIQMEDEIASMAAVVGASWAGVKSMTATSGPGFSLKQENISYADMTETPCVIVDVQRGGPSTGMPTKPATGDIRMARWGDHGGIQHIALCPSSVQECYDFTILAFNLAERFRVPVIILSDAYLAHLYEPLVIKEKVKIFDRIYRPGEPPFGPTPDFSTPSMPNFEDGEFLIITGSAHTSRGERVTADPEVYEALIWHLQNKILERRAGLTDVEEFSLDDAETIIVAYGIVARAAKAAIRELRQKGIRVGLIRPKILWPFPSEKIKKLGKRGKRFLVPEMNQGQLNYVVREKISNEVISLPQPNGQIIDPRRISRFLIEGRW